MSHFRLLKDPQDYAPQDWDFVADHAGRDHWLMHFEQQFAQTMKHASEQYGRTAGKRIATASQDFAATIARLRQAPNSLPSGKLNILELDALREGILRKHGLADPYTKVRARANAAAAESYPEVIEGVDALEDQDRWLRLVRGVFAGNVVDLGSVSTMHLAEAPLDFAGLVEQTRPRPWLVDDFDRLAKDLPASPPAKWSKAVIFVDNAGADFVLGLMPFARELAMHGTKIVLAANEQPALNDMTADETIDVVQRLAALDEDLSALIAAGMFEVVSSGCTIPVIDLSNVSDELNAATGDADLVVLEGMGRAVETNFDARFTVDSLKLALIKNEDVARRLGGAMYDCVCRYAPSGDGS